MTDVSVDGLMVDGLIMIALFMFCSPN